MIKLLIEKALKGRKGKTVLDIGPGYGDFSRIAASQISATQVTYLDCNRDVLEWQERACRDHTIEATCIEGILTLETINELDTVYDLILCQEVLEHLPNPEDIVKALGNKLSQGGCMILTVPTKISERWLRFINPSYMRDEPFGHIQEFNRRRLISMLEKAGLIAIRATPAQPHFFLGHTWLYGSRMKVEGSTGKIVTRGVRLKVYNLLMRFSWRFFRKTSLVFWSHLFPRNYFIAAERISHENPS